jgi:hypothetical protein
MPSGKTGKLGALDQGARDLRSAIVQKRRDRGIGKADHRQCKRAVDIGRPLCLSLDAREEPKDYIARGIGDRSPVVRRVAMSGAIRHLAGTSEGQTYAAALIKDKSPSVRERAKFFLGMNIVE